MKKMPPQQLSKVSKNGEQVAIVRYGSADYSKGNKNKNIYYQAHQINLLKRLREHKDQVDYPDKEVKEDSLEDIGEGDDEGYHHKEVSRDES